MKLLKKFWNEEDGQDLIEYALLMGFISLVVVAILGTIGTSLNTLYTTVGGKLEGANK